MKKCAATLSFLFIVFVSHSYSQHTVIAAKTIVRDQPNAKAKALFTLIKGDVISLKAVQYDIGPSEWYFIAHNTQTGWILAKDMDSVNRFGLKWVKVAETKAGTHQIDASNVKRANGTVWVWQRILLPQSETVAFLIRYELKCATFQYKRLEGTKYSQTTGMKDQIIKPSQYATAQPNTAIYLLVEKVCK
jgi:hypothetical protein